MNSITHRKRGGICDSADMHPVTPAVAADSTFGERECVCGGGGFNLSLIHFWGHPTAWMRE